MANYVEKSWGDATGGKSYIERLHFDGTHKWTNMEIIMTGTRKKTNYKLSVQTNGNEIQEFSGSIKDGETKSFTVNNIADYATIDVTGYISKAKAFYGAGAEIIVRVSYEEEIPMKSESVSWHDSTGGISCIEGLSLEANHKWKSCSILVKGDKNLQTDCKIQLIVNGDIPDYAKSMNQSFNISGTSSKPFHFDINKKASLVVAGRIANQKVVTGAGATVTLTATYEE